MPNIKKLPLPNTRLCGVRVGGIYDRKQNIMNVNYFISIQFLHNLISLVIWFAEYQGVATLPTVVPVSHGSHEDASTTLFRWTLPSQTMDLSIFIHLNKVPYW